MRPALLPALLMGGVVKDPLVFSGQRPLLVDGLEIEPLLALPAREGVPLVRWLWVADGYDRNYLQRVEGTFHVRLWREGGVYYRTMAVATVDPSSPHPLPVLGFRDGEEAFLFLYRYVQGEGQGKVLVFSHPLPEVKPLLSRMKERLSGTCDCQVPVGRPPLEVSLDGLALEERRGEEVPRALARVYEAVLYEPLCFGYLMKLENLEDLFFHSVVPDFAPPTAPYVPGEKVAVGSAGGDGFWFANVVRKPVLRRYGASWEAFLDGVCLPYGCGLKPCGDSVKRPLRYFGPGRKEFLRYLLEGEGASFLQGSPGDLVRTPDGKVHFFFSPAFFAPDWRLVKALARDLVKEFSNQVELKRVFLPAGVVGVFHLVGVPRKEEVKITLPRLGEKGKLEGFVLLRPREVGWLDSLGSWEGS